MIAKVKVFKRTLHETPKEFIIQVDDKFIPRKGELLDIEYGTYIIHYVKYCPKWKKTYGEFQSPEDYSLEFICTEFEDLILS